MSDQTPLVVSQPVAKMITAWSGVGIAEFLQRLGITSWGDAAAAAACMYTMLLIVEWVYKKISLLRHRPDKTDGPSRPTRKQRGGRDG